MVAKQRSLEVGGWWRQVAVGKRADTEVFGKWPQQWASGGSSGQVEVAEKRVLKVRGWSGI